MMQFRNWPQHLEWLRARGFNPTTVIDVGVATDTEELYQFFPNSSYIFVEPCAEFEPSLKNLCQRYRGMYFIVACGREAGSTTLNVSADLGGSSMFRHQLADDPEINVIVEKALGMPGTMERVVPMVTLDDLWEATNSAGPALLKIDVQGGELEVMRGANKCLDHIDIIIMEIGTTETYKNQPVFAEYISYMHERGFCVIDFINAGYNDSGILMEVDAVFARPNGPYSGSVKELLDIHKIHGQNSYKGVKRFTA
jgi:FkbM family methyltransferase